MRFPDLAECQKVRELWNRSQSPYYQIREADLRWNLSHQELVNYRPSHLAGTSVVYAVASSKGELAGLSSRSLWLSLWGEIERGSEGEFLRELEVLAARERKSRIVLGGDEFHLVSGVPADTESGRRLVSAMNAIEFAGNWAVDFIGTQAAPEVKAYILDAQNLIQKNNWTLASLENEREYKELEVFLACEFPGRWAREFQFWRAHSDTRRGIWTAMKQSGELIGFARMAIRSRLLDLDEGWSPGALRLPFSQNKNEAMSARDSCLGPIGVASSQRGRGAGRALLSLVLETLGRHDAGRVCVDWTNAIKYYYPLQFAQVRKFWVAEKIFET